jgi:signal peptidase II
MTQLNKQLNSAPDSNCDLVFPDYKAHLIFWLIFISGLFLDLYSKKIIFQRLSNDSSFDIIDGILRFVTAENTGAAFGIAAGKRFLLVGTSVIALVGVIAVFIFGHIRQRLVQVALGLFAAGVTGNLYDRIFNDGRVRDFIDVVYWPGVHWPAFNIADSMLCISVGLLIISSLRTHPESRSDNSTEPRP